MNFDMGSRDVSSVTSGSISRQSSVGIVQVLQTELIEDDADVDEN